MNITEFSQLKNLFSSQKTMYLVVGFYNTIFGYLTFVSIFYFFSPTINYSFLLAACYIISAINNFFLYRYFVFKVAENILKDLFRFTLVNIFIYIINLLLFSLLYEIVHLNVYLAQALIINLIIILGYFLNKNVSFFRKQ